jgi:hypothetical protein
MLRKIVLSSGFFFIARSQTTLNDMLVGTPIPNSDYRGCYKVSQARDNPDHSSTKHI